MNEAAKTVARQTLEQIARGRKPHKYRAQPTVVDGIRFDSKAEARRYVELKLLVRAGQISMLTLQPSFDCIVNGQLICRYRADFEYMDHNGERLTVEDVKSPITAKNPVYRIKKKLVEALYQIQIRETK